MTAAGRCRLAMVGAGRIALEGHVPAFQANADILEVVAVVDPDRSRRAAVEKSLSAPPRVSAATLRQALDATPVDVAVIATPPSAHHDAILQALEGGLAVVCEKPLCRSLDEVESIRAAIDDSGCYLSVMHNYLYKPGWRSLFDLVASGRIGAPVFARFEELSADHWRAPDTAWRRVLDEGGGPLRDNLYHALYLAERILGSPIVEVQATQASLVHGYGAGDVAMVALIHENSSVTQATSAWCFPGKRRAVVEVVGTEACIRYEYWERPDQLLLERSDRVETISVPDWAPGTEWGYTAAFRDAVTRVAAGRKPAHGVDDAARFVEIMERAATPVASRPRRRLPGRRLRALAERAARRLRE